MTFPHEWTQRWWESLPIAYRRADAVQSEEVGFYPLKRFMDGPGQVGGMMRAISDDLYAGVYTDPARVPDGALPWLAQMMGVTERQRKTTPEALRGLLIDLTVSGRAVTGTRAGIAEVAKRFLTGARQVSVRPSTDTAHTIVMLVRADEVPGADLAGLVDFVRAAGVVPAGHNLIALNASPTWNEYEASDGVTWNDYEALTPTWSDEDSLGVVLEE